MCVGERDGVFGRERVFVGEIVCGRESVCGRERVCGIERVCVRAYGRARAWESESVGERERGMGEWENERECGRGRDWGNKREIVGEQRMWERTENVGTDLDLSLIVFLVCLFV